MANSKISALTSATTPLAGTETLPIVQSGATTKVTVANLTAGRAITALSVTSTNAFTTGGTALFFGDGSDNSANVYATGGSVHIWPNATNTFDFTTDGNLKPLTAAKGINFTANTPAAGMTSQLLNWYEEGTWTPVLSAYSGTITTPGASTGTYTRIGRNVTLSIDSAITVNGTAAIVLFITGMPFTGSTATVSYYSGSGEERSTGFALSVEYQPTNNRIAVSTYAGLYPGGNNTRFIISITYQV